jgi:deazaflavin-dependent oxidoreductase (nitroreductase family)
MDRRMPARVPESLAYRDGEYTPEWLPRAMAAPSLRAKRVVTRSLRALHWPWFALWMPTGVATLTTTGRKSGKPRTTFVRAYRDGDKAYLVSIGGEHALWLKNIRANPRVTLRFRSATLTGVARDLRDDAELDAVRNAFCGRTHPFDYAENIFHRMGLPTRTRIIELHQAWLAGGTPLIVEFEAAPRR